MRDAGGRESSSARQWSARQLLPPVAALIIMGGAIFFVSSPALMFRIFGGQFEFNRAVRELVPKGATLAQLEEAVGPGTPVGGEPTWMRKLATDNPAYFPDGFQARDTYVRYSFEQQIVYFQLRNGRLVNHDPQTFVSEVEGPTGLSQ